MALRHTFRKTLLSGVAMLGFFAATDGAKKAEVRDNGNGATQAIQLTPNITIADQKALTCIS